MAVVLVIPKALDQEVARLNYQLANTNETGQEVVRHLRDTDQDPSVVIDKVDGINSQWDQLHTKLLQLRNRVGDKVSPEKFVRMPSRYTSHSSRFAIHTSCITLHLSHSTFSRSIV